jgi:L-seryl-tRNA(Ser) seleniumtransferase
LLERLPTLRLLTRDVAEIRAQAEALLPTVQSSLGTAFVVSVAECHSQIGSGSLPVDTIASVALHIAPASGADPDLRQLAQSLRQLPLPVIGRIHKNALWLDLRCLETQQQPTVIDQLHSFVL